ncbi:MAG: PDC sensor domain-containing protein [Thermoflexaceae bacterium]|nr:PDC sensor domain-containing protein [Thermoflexaceae bacterium]
MRRLPSLTLRARLLLLVALAVLPALALVLWTTAERRDQAHDDATAETLQLSDLVARDVAASIQHARRVLRALAAVPEIRQVDPAACQEILRSVRPENPELGVLWVADPSDEPDQRCRAQCVPAGGGDEEACLRHLHPDGAADGAAGRTVRGTDPRR